MADGFPYTERQQRWWFANLENGGIPEPGVSQKITTPAAARRAARKPMSDKELAQYEARAEQRQRDNDARARRYWDEMRRDHPYALTTEWTPSPGSRPWVVRDLSGRPVRLFSDPDQAQAFARAETERRRRTWARGARG